MENFPDFMPESPDNQVNSEEETSRALQQSRDEKYRKDLNERKNGGSSKNP